MGGQCDVCHISSFEDILSQQLSALLLKRFQSMALWSGRSGIERSATIHTGKSPCLLGKNPYFYGDNPVFIEKSPQFAKHETLPLLVEEKQCR